MKIDYFLGLSEEGFHKVIYTEWGTDKVSTPIICIHGMTRNRRDFDSLSYYLSEYGSHVFCPDLVGHGDSDWLKNPLHYTYEQYIADMNVMIAKTNATEVDWIGTSMGGVIGMFLASVPNSPIRSLVLNDIGPQIPIKGLTRLSTYVGSDPVFSNLEEAKAYFKTIYSGFGNLSDSQWQYFTENSIQERSPGKFTTKIDHGIKMAQTKSKIAWRLLLHPLKALEGTLFDVDLWSVWRKIKCPVLVIRGRNSDILEKSTVEKMQAIHPEIEVVEIADAGHAPALVDIAQQELIHKWLTKLR